MFAPSRRPIRRPAFGGHRFRPFLEQLEDRLSPATFSTSGTALTITLDHINEAITTQSNGASYALTSSDTTVDNGTNGGHNSVTNPNSTTHTATIDATFYTSVAISGAATGTRVAFLDSG